MSLVSNFNPSVGSINILEPLSPNLSSASALLEEGLQYFVTSSNFLSNMTLVFGESHDYRALQPILAGGVQVF